MLCFLSFFNMFAMSEALFNLQLYVGLFMFLGYIVFGERPPGVALLSHHCHIAVVVAVAVLLLCGDRGCVCSCR
jgi:hypothetical protein